MLEEMKSFFQGFADDVSTFDGAVIASRYHTPYMAVSSDGDMWPCSTHEDTITYFQSLLDRHSSQGVVSCKYEDLDWSTVGNKCFMASVTWTMMGKDGETITHWRESYNLINTENGLKIFTSIDH